MPGRMSVQKAVSRERMTNKDCEDHYMYCFVAIYQSGASIKGPVRNGSNQLLGRLLRRNECRRIGPLDNHFHSFAKRE
jgi:hypothetical protein